MPKLISMRKTFPGYTDRKRKRSLYLARCVCVRVDNMVYRVSKQRHTDKVSEKDDTNIYYDDTLSNKIFICEMA